MSEVQYCLLLPAIRCNIESAAMKDSLPEALLSCDQNREHLTNQVLDATTLEEIGTARRLLQNWIKAYPDEEGMSDAFEQLSLLEDLALEEAKPAAERAAWLYAD